MNLGARSKLCPRVEAAFSLLAKKWMGLIVYSLTEGELYFSELERLLPSLSARVLTERVRELESAGLVSRLVGGASPVRVSYRLTEKGQSLAAIIHQIGDWASSQGLA
jgi:DNA-binding HxlR family transcriptional regulator